VEKNVSASELMRKREEWLGCGEFYNNNNNNNMMLMYKNIWR
jgi:hypothetical protein